MEEKMSFIDLHKGEQFTDNRNVDIFTKCKTCKYRDKTVIGFKKVYCEIYEKGDPKPLSIMYGGDCDFYREDKDAEQSR